MIKQFFEDDEKSRMYPGMKDGVSVRNNERQKELCVHFKTMKLDLKIRIFNLCRIASEVVCC